MVKVISIWPGKMAHSSKCSLVSSDSSYSAKQCSQSKAEPGWSNHAIGMAVRSLSQNLSPQEALPIYDFRFSILDFGLRISKRQQQRWQNERQLSQSDPLPILDFRFSIWD